MVFINEWLPYPAANNATVQFVELKNSGDQAVDLAGWRLEKANGKKFLLNGLRIPPGGYVVLMRTQTKLALVHTSEELSLYDAAGKLRDRSYFNGTALKGKSFSRVDEGGGPAQHFAWSDPTPGAENHVQANTLVARIDYPRGVPLNDHAAGSFLALLGAVVFASAILAALVVYCLKSNETLNELLFSGDRAPR